MPYFEVMLTSEQRETLPAVPMVSVVIITRNEGPELLATTYNVLATLPAGRRGVIVVDDDSTDASPAFLADLQEIRLFHSPGVGVARARNYGASQATGDVVVFVDAHMRMPDGWHGPLVEALRDPHVGAVA